MPLKASLDSLSGATIGKNPSLHPIKLDSIPWLNALQWDGHYYPGLRPVLPAPGNKESSTMKEWQNPLTETMTASTFSDPGSTIHMTIYATYGSQLMVYL